MALFLTNDVELWASKLPETTYNTQYATNTDFEKIQSTNPAVYIPNYDQTNDAGLAGNGHEFATRQCLTYVQHPSIPIANEINTEIGGRLLLRSVGGTVVDAVVSGSASSHTAPMLPPASGRQLPSTTLISKLASADTLMAGAVVERARLSQQRANAMIYEVDLVASGKIVTPNGVASLPTTPNFIACLDGNLTQLQWTDAGGTRDFTAGEGFRNAFIEVVNNSKLNDRQAGDSTVALGPYETVTANRYYTRKLIRGSRVVTAAITIPLNSTNIEWQKYTIGQQVTDVTLRGRGPIITGAIRQSVAMIIPKAYIQSIVPGDDDGDAVITINLLPIYDSVSGGVLKVEIVNNTAANYK